MHKYFWQSLPHPFFALAPMEDVTDTVFRQVIAECAKPSVFFTEFISADGFCMGGQSVAEQKMRYVPAEHPIIAQLWGIEPTHFYETTEALIEMGFDGIDINMGCPKRSVVKHGACAGLIANPPLARDIVQAVQDASGGRIPVSVKTRIGTNKIITEEWISFLLSLHLDAVTVHLRTAKEQSKVPAHWDEMKKIVMLRDNVSPKTVLIGNGDVPTREVGAALAATYGIEGIMIGRGVFTNPWVFEHIVSGQVSHTHQEYQRVFLRHLELYKQTWGAKKNYNILKKFFKIYIRDFPHAQQVREELMKTTSVDEAEAIVSTLI